VLILLELLLGIFLSIYISVGLVVSTNWWSSFSANLGNPILEAFLLFRIRNSIIQCRCCYYL